MAASDLLAHGIGGRQDLPIPFTYAVLGAVVALVVSFAALGLLWQTSRFDGARAGRPVPLRVQGVLDAPTTRWTIRIVGLVGTGYVGLAAVFGPDSAVNPTPSVLYVLFWVGLVPASLLFGPVWRALNPVRTVHLLLCLATRRPPEAGLLPFPAWLGYWPAAAALLSFGWLELVAPDRATLPVLRSYLGAYAGVMLLGASLFGSRWFARADGFEVYSTLLGRLAPLGRRQDGRLVLRSPFEGLDALRPEAGLVAVVAVLLGTTAFDGLSSSTWWVASTQEGQWGSPVRAGTTGLLVCILSFGLAYLAATLAAGRLGEPGASARRWYDMPRTFVGSIVPIVVGYVVAHYFSLLLFEGQNAVILLSDPLGNGANVLGVAGREVDYTVVSPAAIALVQVLAVVLGHVLGVVSAHDRAVRLFSRRQAVVGQVPLLLLMVCYTVAGLVLLFAG